MIFVISQSFVFEAAHTLERRVPVEEYEKSVTIHGHTYNAEISVTGEIGESGMIEIPISRRKHGPMILDLYVLRKAIQDVKKELDHSFLDDLLGKNKGTMENLCVFIANHIDKTLPVSSVSVWRQTGDKCVYTL